MSDPGLKVHEPTPVNCTPAGFRPRLCAIRAEPAFGPMPWTSVEFDQPPHAANMDLWIEMDCECPQKSSDSEVPSSSSVLSCADR